MKRLLTIKGMVVVGVIAMIVAGSVAYAAQLFNLNLTGSVQVGISSSEPIQLFAEDGITRINDGDNIDFGAAEVDFFGRGPLPVRGPFVVKNISNGPVQVQVTGGDPEGAIVPLFGPGPGDLEPAPDNTFILAAPGEGDTVEGFLGLRFLAPSAGNKQIPVVFTATELGVSPPPAINLTFERSFPYPAGQSSIVALGSDGVNLYAFDGSNTLLVLDPISGAVLDSFPGPGQSANTALTYDGTNLISANFADNNIFVINPSDGSLVRSFTTTPVNVQGLGFDGTWL